MWDDWVIDVTLYNPELPNMLCFVPIEDIESDNPKFVFGMNLLTSLDGFDQGKIRGVIHADGTDALDKWCKEYPDIYKEILKVT